MDIITAAYVKSSPGYKECPPPTFPEFAFIGRSNVGKSSLINLIANKKNLARTSGTPGKTQIINHYKVVASSKKPVGKEWYLVDLPGYGYAKVAQSARRNWENMIESYIRKRENLKCTFVLVDSRLEPQQADLDFINKFGEWNAPFVLVFTKADKNKPKATERNIQNFLAAMARTWEELPPFFVSSSVTRAGREEILDYIDDLASS
jgi:GTP-binding protein